MEHLDGTPEATPAGEQGNAVQRDVPRDSMFLIAKVRVQGKRQAEQVRVRNLSAGGIMAEIGMLVAPGTRVEVELRGIGKITGSVAWSMAGRAGIAFDSPIDPLLARKPVGTGGTTPAYVKPIIVR